MQKKILPVLLLSTTALFSGNSFADWIEFRPLPTTKNKSENSFDYEIKTIKSDDLETIIEFTLFKADVSKESIKVDNTDQEFAKIRLHNGSILEKTGLPQLPQISIPVAVPQESKGEIEVLQMEKKQFSWGMVLPSKGEFTRNIDPEDIPLKLDQRYLLARNSSGQAKSNSRGEENQWPKENILKKSSYRLRNIQGETFVLFPFHYNFANKQTYVTTKMVFKIKHQGGNKKSHLLHRSQGLTQSFSQLYAENFVNYKNVQERTRGLNVQGDKMLVIAHSDFEKVLAPFLHWKNQMGIQTTLLTTNEINRSPYALKELIQDFYKKNPELGYVLLVGDAHLVPFFPGTEGNAFNEEADPMYGLLEGEDQYPEVVVARIPVENNQDLEKVIKKSMSYERDELMGNWPMAASGIASDQGWPSDKQRADKIRKLLLSKQYNRVDRLYDPNVVTSEILDAINDGRGYMNYTGHGSITSWVTGEFSNDEVDRLENYGKWPMIISVACVNGKFSYEGGDSFAERWLKAGTLAQPTGAIGIFASSTNQSWVPPTVGQAKIAQLITSSSGFSIGQLMTQGSIAVLDDNSSTAVQTFQTWHIFGDPSIQLRNTQSLLAKLEYANKIKIENPNSNGTNARTRVRVEQAQATDRFVITNTKGIVKMKLMPQGSTVELEFDREDKENYELTISGKGKIPYILSL